MNNILIVDDDINIGNMLEEILTKEGYQITRAYSGTEALFALSSKRPDLILLDLMLPGLNGKEVLPKITGIPVIIISAKTGVEDKVELLLGGAADYVTKPFDIEELLARITVQLRNASARASAGASASTLKFEDILIDTDSHQVTLDGEIVRLTRTEYAILKLLMRNPSQVVTKTLLLERLSEDTPDCMESSLRVHISNLRKKLRDLNGKDYIEAVWGIGFKMKEE